MIQHVWKILKGCIPCGRESWNPVPRKGWLAFSPASLHSFWSVAQWCLTLCNPHGLQHTRLSCPSLSPGVCSNFCPLSQWHQPSHPLPHLLFLPSIFPSIRVFSNESALRIRWRKYWSFSFSFSISPSNECWGLISFRTDWFDLLALHNRKGINTSSTC